MKVTYLKHLPSRVGLKIALKDIEEGDILQIPYPGYARCYSYFRVQEGILYNASRKKSPTWNRNYYYTKHSIKDHWLYHNVGTVIGHYSQ